jgi:AraC-like DNA-binding protein
MELDQSNLLERAALESTYLMPTVSWAQLDPGMFDVRYGVIDAAPLEISFRRFNLGFKAEAEVAPQKTMIGLMADPRSRARWFGIPTDATSIAATRSTIDVRTEGPGAFYQITLDEAALRRQFPNAPDALFLLENITDARLTHDHMHAARLRACVHRIFSLGHKVHATILPHGLPLRIISGTLIPLLATALHTLDEAPIESSKSITRRFAAVRTCETYMRDHVDSTITLLDLSEVSGMRSRSLINAFQAVTGFSPIDYFKRLRLNGVHRALQGADKPRTRIIDVATAFGFWHMGHFAVDYRVMFGEAPSQTLARS